MTPLQEIIQSNNEVIAILADVAQDMHEMNTEVEMKLNEVVGGSNV